jgi:effector-binding domain-containing protein
MNGLINNDNKECCPKFDPTPWDEKEFEWQDKKFIKDKVKTFLFMPVNFGAVMKKLNQKVEQSGAKPVDYLCLADHANKWRMDLLLAVDKEIQDAENVTLSGKYTSKVYEGPYKDAGKWHKDFEAYAKDKGHNLLKTYIWYTTCPKCAKKYGKNYTVIIGQIG